MGVAAAGGTNIMPTHSATNAAARSITCINNGSNNLSSTVISTNSIHVAPSLNIQASPAYGAAAVPYHKSSIPGLYSHHSQQGGGRVTVFSGSGFQGVGAGSPTKSMSSGMFIYLFIFLPRWPYNDTFAEYPLL